jgi:hypothetical protein
MRILVSRSVLRPSALALAAFLAAGCNSKDAEKCTQGLTVTRQALAAENFDSAKQWRTYAYAQCEDQGALAALDKEISEREAAVVLRKETEAKKKAETALLLKGFADFVAQNRAAPDRASAAPVCDPPPAGAPSAKPGEESKDRFCTATRQLGAYAVQVRFWQADPQAFRFSVKPEDPATCDALGPATVSKTWEVPAVTGASVKRERCDLGGPLSGLHAVVSQAARAEVSVFSPQYLDREPGMKTILSGP